MQFRNRWFGSNSAQRTLQRRPATSLQVEALESRNLMSASPLPVLLVIADQQDFYFKEYNDTRNSLEAKDVNVVVAATTTNVSIPHALSGQQEAGVSGEVVPDIALANVDPSDYSAIVFVGGWGSSMYQYAYNDPNLDGTVDNWYWNWQYNGEASLNGDPNTYDGVIESQKVIVNNLINQFLADDKPVAAVCHAVTVLAWARVDGVSPLAGLQVSVPINPGAPNQHYNGVDYAYPNFAEGQRLQVLDNGGIPNLVSGQYGDPGTSADDVVVAGRIITAEDFNSAAYFGTVVAQEVWANLPDVYEPAVLQDGNLVLTGTDANDVVYIWSNGPGQSVSAWMNGVNHGPFTLGPGGRVIVHGGDGNDQIFATDATVQVSIFGGAGHDQITGGSANDLLDGGDGVDRVWGNAGDDVLVGGAGNDYLHGREGNDILLGGAGDDYLEGFDGRDVLIGGLGVDNQRGQGGEDLLIGGLTSYDNDTMALANLGALWSGAGPLTDRIALLSNPAASLRLLTGDTVQDDGVQDVLVGGEAGDWFSTLGMDLAYTSGLEDRVIR